MLLFVIAMVCTRNLFAWSVDRVLPERVTKVDRRFHAPWVATLIIVAAAEILLALYVFTSVFDKVSNYIVLFSIAFWMASFAAILLPYRRPEIFAAAPDYVQRRIGNVPVITLLGVGNLILFSMVLYSAFKLPAFSGPTGSEAVLFVIGVYVVGLLIYLAAKAIQTPARHRPRPALPRDPARVAVRIFYASDVHGSDRCFRKFLGARKFYGADALVLGGDITGKAIVPLVRGRRRGARDVPRLRARAHRRRGGRRARAADRGHRLLLASLHAGRGGGAARGRRRAARAVRAQDRRARGAVDGARRRAAGRRRASSTPATTTRPRSTR